MTNTDDIRYAIFYLPKQSSELWKRASQWLEYDSYLGEIITSRVKPKHLSIYIQRAAKYGFHGTLKAPFRLHQGKTEEELLLHMDTVAKQLSPISTDGFEILQIGKYLALTLSDEAGGIHNKVTELANHCVEIFDVYRKPMAEDDRQQRLTGLNARQIQLLDQWGYPYVQEQYQFHMTLADSIPENMISEVSKFAYEYLGDSIKKPINIDAISVLKQVNGKPFEVIKTSFFS